MESAVSQQVRGGGTARWVLTALIVLGLAQTIWRGPMRAFDEDGVHDLAAIYGPARAWLEGLDPYDGAAVERVLREAGYDGVVMRLPKSRLGVYPPVTYVALTPIAAMPWRAANLTWMALSIAGMAALMGQLVWLVRWLGEADQKTQPRLCDRVPIETLAVAVGLLMLAPFHTNLMLGQTSIVATVLVVGAFMAAVSHRPVLAGVLAGVAMALKPQVGVVALAYLATRFHWRATFIGMATVAVLFGVGLAQLAANAPEWRVHLEQNMQVFNEGGFGDPTMQGRFRHQLLGLHVLLHMFIEDRQAVTVLAVTFGAVVTLLAMGHMTGQGSRRRELLFFSVLGTACLLTAPGHRFYNAMLLVVPMVYGLHLLGLGRRDGAGALREGGKRVRRAVMLLLPVAVFAVPGSAALYILAGRGMIPEMLTRGWLWHGVLMPQNVWALLAMLALLLVELRRVDRTARVAAPEDTKTTTTREAVETT